MKTVLPWILAFVIMILTMFANSKQVDLWKVILDSFPLFIHFSYLFILLSFFEQIKTTQPRNNKKWINSKKLYLNLVFSLLIIDCFLCLLMEGIIDNWGLLFVLFIIVVVIETYTIESITFNKLICKKLPFIKLSSSFYYAIPKLLLFYPIGIFLYMLSLGQKFQNISFDFFLSGILALSFSFILLIVYYLYIKEQQKEI